MHFLLLSFSCARLHCHFLFFFFNDTATTEIYTLSLHDALPILGVQLLEWEVAEHVAHLARVHVILFEGEERCREKPLAERALVVGELDEGHRGVGASQNRCGGHARTHGPAGGDAALDWTLAQQAQQLPELALDGLQ